MTRHRERPSEPVTIRVAAPEDTKELRRLPELDSARPLTGYVLLAEQSGMPVAAISMALVRSSRTHSGGRLTPCTC